MTRIKLGKRVSALEARGDSKRESEHSAAFKFILDAVYIVLPDITAVWHREYITPYAYKMVTDVPRVSTWTRVEELASRIEAKLLTDGDQEALAALDQRAETELRMLGYTAAGFVECLGRFSREFNAMY